MVLYREDRLSLEDIAAEDMEIIKELISAEAYHRDAHNKLIEDRKRELENISKLEAKTHVKKGRYI